MSLHSVSIQWSRRDRDFSYESYDRTHKVKFGGGIEISASAAPEYLGRAEFVNPEEALAAAASSCHMLTFLAIASKSKLVVESYEDFATAVLEKDTRGKICITKIILEPRILFSGENLPDNARLQDLHEKAHRNCFIANSINCHIEVKSKV